MSRSTIWSTGANKKLVKMLSVGDNVHQDSKIRYLLNDTYESSTTFNRKGYPFGVSFNKLNDRWKQTVFSSSRPQIVPGTLSFGSYQTRVSNNFLLTKSPFFGLFDYMECMSKKTVSPLSVGNNIHQDTDLRYLSNDSFWSSTAFNQEEYPFGVSFNNLNDRL